MASPGAAVYDFWASNCDVSDHGTPPDEATPDGTIPYRFNFLTQRFQSNHQPNRKSILGFRGLFCRLPDLCQLKQQSRRRYATDGFALLPHTYRFLGRQSFGCRSQAGEASRMPSPSSPSSHSSRDDPSPTEEE